MAGRQESHILLVQRGAVKKIPWEKGRSPIYLIQIVAEQPLEIHKYLFWTNFIRGKTFIPPFS